MRQRYVYSQDLFNRYSEEILRELKTLPGSVICGSNLNNIRYADDTVLIDDLERNLEDLLESVVEESVKKGLTVSYKKTENMVKMWLTNWRYKHQAGAKFK